MKFKICALGVVALAGVAFGTTANATAQLSLSDGTTTVTITDNGAGDLNSGAGVIVWSGIIGIWNLNVSTGTTYPFEGALDHAAFDLNSINNSTGAGTMTIKFTQTGFASGPANTTSSVGGTTDNGTATFQALFGAANAPFAGTLISQLGPFGPRSFSGDMTGGIAGGNPYSITQVATIVHTAGGQTSFDYRFNVPEPGTLGLLGLSLLGFGVTRRRK